VLKNASLGRARKGWLFCLNAPLEQGKGSHWGYVEDFYRSVEAHSVMDGDSLTMTAEIWGKPYSNKLRLQPGDGLAFYHGKKARKASSEKNKRRHIKPYQISLMAIIDSVTQDESNGQVKEIRFSYPKGTLQAMRTQPLLLDNHNIQAIIKESGLGSGRVGAFFPLAPKSWRGLLGIAGDR
jgi:hypothetical protein